LFLYASAIPQNPFTRKFVEFALSKDGQDIVANSGFIDVRKEEPTLDQQPLPTDYKRLTQAPSECR